ncbi:general substrate transporter [Globomyces pollinis-pini]|nr:general substrate transporter [Globomyces pollinis-pini]
MIHFSKLNHQKTRMLRNNRSNESVIIEQDSLLNHMEWNNQKSHSNNFYGYVVAFAAGIGGLLFGYEIGVIGQVLSLDTFCYDFGALAVPLQKDDNGAYLQSEYYQTLNQYTTFTFLMGCSIGSVIVAYLADMIGRRKTILCSGILFLMGAIAQSFAPKGPNIHSIFYSGRFVGGVGIGMASMCVPLYISETAPTSIRGRLITIQQLMITLGILIASIVNAIIISLVEPVTGFLPQELVNGSKGFEWRYALAVQMIPALCLIVVMIFMPESPRWLIMNNLQHEALKTMATLQQLDVTNAALVEEFEEMIDMVTTEKLIGSGDWNELISFKIRKRTFITFFLQLFQQWTGINVIFYYGPQLLEQMGFEKRTSQIQGAITNNFVNFISTFPGMYFVETFGRRSLFIWGGIGCFVSQFFLTYVLTMWNQDSSFTNAIALTCICTFTLSFGSTWGPCAWIYQSEVFPLRVRAKGTGLATFSNWFNGAIVSYLNPVFLKSFPNQVFAVYGAMDVMATVFAYLFVPETMGQSLEDMDAIFQKVPLSDM